MIAYGRLHVLRAMRRPLGHAAVVASVTMAPIVFLGAFVSRSLGRDEWGRLSPEEAAASGLLFGSWSVIGFTAMLAADAAHDERLENRVVLLRAAGLDGWRATLGICAAAAVAGFVLSALSIVALALAERGAVFPAATLLLAGLANALGAAALAAIAVLAASFVPRSAWTIGVVLAAGGLAGGTMTTASSRELPAWAAALAASAVLSIGLAVLVPVLADVLPRRHGAPARRG